MTLKQFREKVNLLIYDAKPKVLGALTVMNVIVSLTALGTLVYFYGFGLTQFSREVCFTILELSFGFYIFRFLLKLFFDFHPPTFLKNNWFEGII